MESELKAQEKELSDDITNLNKKVSPGHPEFSTLLILAISQNS